MPAATQAKSTPIRTPPASAYSAEGRLLGSIWPEHTKFVTASDRLKQAKTEDFVLRRLALLDASTFFAPPDHRVRELHDLEQVHHVDRRGEGDEAEERKDER